MEAVKKGSDGLIITGRWTGEAPLIEDLRNVREAVKDFMILVGSGADKDNIKEIFEFTDAIIVSTSLKEGENKEGERNVKSYDAKIDLNKVKEFVGIVKEINSSRWNNPR